MSNITERRFDTSAAMATRELEDIQDIAPGKGIFIQSYLGKWKQRRENCPDGTQLLHLMGHYIDCHFVQQTSKTRF